LPVSNSLVNAASVFQTSASRLGPRCEKLSRPTTVLVLAMVFGFAAPSGGYAATLTVCASGCNYTTIAAAIAAAKADDTISILDAVHTEGGITVDRNLIIAGKGAAKTALVGGFLGTVFSVNSGVAATFQNLTIRDSSSGAIYNSGSVSIQNCAFSGNFGPNGGAAVYNASGTLTINNSTFSKNVSFGGGGALANADGTMTISSSILSGNGSHIGGGAVANAGGTVVVSNSSLSGNGGRVAGAIYNQQGSLILSNSAVSDNDAIAGGGVENEGTFTIINSTLDGNRADYSGGAAFNDGTVQISFSTLSANIERNEFGVNDGGGGITNFGSATVKNSIVADNTLETPDGSASPGDCAGTITASGANFDTSGSCGTTNFTQVTSAELNLGAFTLNPPGTTATRALLSGSVAIGAVTDCTDVDEKSVTTDQRGTLRPDPGDTVCDAGAYELQKFAGQPNCVGKSNSALAQQYGGLSAAASAYGFSTVKQLKAAVRKSCEG